MRHPACLLLLTLPLVAACGPGGADGPAIAFVLDETSLVMGRDETATIGLTLYRSGGYEGDVVVQLGGTSADVTSPPLTLADPDVVGRLELTTGRLAAPGEFALQVQARGGGVAPATTTIRLRILGAPGTLDPDFGAAGTTVTSIVTPAGRTVGGRAEGLTVLPDDRIVVVGTARIPEGAGAGGTIYSTEICLARYRRDGTLDETFGDGGLVFTRIDTEDPPEIPAQAHGRDVIHTSRGELVVTGPAVPGDNTDQLVARYRSDGSLDPTFGTGGIVLTDIADGRDNHGNALAEDADGRYVVVGWQGDGLLTSIMSITRYNRDGTLDTTFGGGATGFRLHVFAGVRCEATGVDILPDGSIVVVGWADVGPTKALAVLKLDASGRIDTSFGIGGEYLLDWVGEHEARAVSAADGSPMVAGRYEDRGLFVGLKERGGEDDAFLIGGVNRTGIDGSDLLYEDLLESAAWLYGAGTFRTLTGGGSVPSVVEYEAVVSRLHPEGLLDASFGTAGFARVQYLLTLPSTGVGVARQSDGTLILAGTANPEFGQFGVARLFP